MARICIEIIKENEGEWETVIEDQKEERTRKEKEEDKAERIEKC